MSPLSASDRKSHFRTKHQKQTQFLCKLETSGANLRCWQLKQWQDSLLWSSSFHRTLPAFTCLRSALAASRTLPCPLQGQDAASPRSSDSIQCRVEFRAHFLQKSFHQYLKRDKMSEGLGGGEAALSEHPCWNGVLSHRGGVCWHWPPAGH